MQRRLQLHNKFWCTCNNKFQLWLPIALLCLPLLLSCCPIRQLLPIPCPLSLLSSLPFSRLLPTPSLLFPSPSPGAPLSLPKVLPLPFSLSLRLFSSSRFP